MPRVKLNAPKRDRIKELVIGGKIRYGYSDDDMARFMGVSRATYSMRINHQHTDEWSLIEIKRLCKALGVEIIELREAVKYG